MRRSALILAILAILAAPAHAVTSYSRMVARLQTDCARSPRLTMANLGKSASGSRSVWIVRVAAMGADDRKTARILILCRQHGDEPVSTEAALGILDRIAAGKDGVSRNLGRVTLYILPMVNPDGADALTRENGKGVDLNRDWSHFQAPETRAVMRAYKAIRPQVVLDMHSWDPSDVYRNSCIESPRDLTGGAAGTAARLSGAVASDILRALHAGGEDIDATSYGADADPDLCHRYFAERLNTPALLFETRPGPDSGADFAGRVALAQSFITDAVGRIAQDSTLRAEFARAAPSHAQADIAAIFPPTDAAAAAATPIRPPSGLRRIPLAIWCAIALYALGAFVIGKCKPRPVAAGVIRLTGNTGAGGKQDGVIRAVYTRMDQPVTHPPLTRPKNTGQ